MNQLPRFIQILATFLLGDYDRQAVTGDLVEIYAAAVTQHGRLRATASVIAELMTLSLRSARHWMKSDVRFAHMLVTGVLGAVVTVVCVAVALRAVLPGIAVFMLVVGLMIARSDSTPFRIRFALAFTAYASWMTSSLIVSFATVDTRVLHEPRATLTWFSLYLPLLLLAGALGAFPVALFAVRARLFALLIAAVPVAAYLVHQATWVPPDIPLAVYVVFPCSTIVRTLRITPLRGWSLLGDVLLWAAVAYVAMRRLRLEIGEPSQEETHGEPANS